MTERALAERAYEMLDRAYCPYSRFPVGAALLAEDGRVFTGCNVESAAYGSTICAERVALCKAVSEGARRFTALAVVGTSEEPCYPCGACRQMLREFSAELKIIVGNGKGELWETDLATLLPHSFGSSHLAQRDGQKRD